MPGISWGWRSLRDILRMLLINTGTWDTLQVQTKVSHMLRAPILRFPTLVTGLTIEISCTCYWSFTKLGIFNYGTAPYLTYSEVGLHRLMIPARDTLHLLLVPASDNLHFNFTVHPATCFWYLTKIFCTCYDPHSRCPAHGTHPKPICPALGNYLPTYPNPRYPAFGTVPNPRYPALATGSSVLYPYCFLRIQIQTKMSVRIRIIENFKDLLEI